MGEVVPMPPRRKFVFAPDMDKLRERVREAEDASQKALEAAAEMVEDIGEADDYAERLVYLVASIRDVKRGFIDMRELQSRATEAVTNLDLEKLPTGAVDAIKVI